MPRGPTPTEPTQVPSPPTPAPAPAQTSTLEGTDFDRWLRIYEENYVKYRTTGNEAFKTIYTEAKRYLDNYVQYQQQQLAANSTNIQRFVNEITADEGGVVNSDRLENAVKDGPKVYDDLLTHQKALVVPEYSSIWGKVAVSAGLLIVAGVAATIF